MSVPAFCQRLAHAMAARQLNRNALLHLAGPDFTYRKIQAYCAGESAPSLSFLQLLGELGFDLHFLITGHASYAIDSGVPHALLAQLAQSLTEAQATVTTLAQLPPPSPLPMQPVAPGKNEAAILAALRSAPMTQQELILAMLSAPAAPAVKGAGA